MAAGDLTTLASVEQYLSLSAGNTDEAVLSSMISACSAAAATYTGRNFASQTYDEVRDGAGGRRLMLKNTPVTAVASLSIDNSIVPVSSGYGGGSAPSSGYVFDANSITLFGYQFCRGLSNIVVTYTAGYAVIPADLAQAIVKWVGHEYREMTRLGMASKAMDGETTSFVVTDMPKFVALILDRYKRVAPGVP